MQQATHFDLKKRMDSASRFLTTESPKGQEDYYNEVSLLLGKEQSIANIKEEHMPSYIKNERAVQEMLIQGQIGLARCLLVSRTAELKGTMSIDGLVILNILENEVKYTQSVYEYPQSVEEKRGFLGRKK